MTPLNVLGSSAGTFLPVDFGAPPLDNLYRPLTDADLRAFREIAADGWGNI